MRLFFALWLEPEVRDAIEYVSDGWDVTGRRVPRNNIHCTLAFLGSVDERRYDRLLAAAAVIEVPRCELSINSSGFWPKPRVAWLGATEAPQALTVLSEELSAAARDCEIPVETRAFRPHITVYRKASRPPSDPEPFTINWSITEYCLMESITASQGVRYRVMQRWPCMLA